ncbi:protoporphyrinogen oxidase HemJ [Pseudohoeflea coraliihabitans]|uniref:Protoporphyrinogen IX oxidase n=1 Tax=Pseudohoeflea coraliihabitans TaxID=2860393 RepID=A0ABS6WT48_9HYPH|nr:protoporphyrinogen oxidase HemJ [Pseudohoeflea sp. DP4N28-3]MBW3099139.1 protoporphyrinogen oxidase HemJ [Pseudohoeflea sp. DP4N28-3]
MRATSAKEGRRAAARAAVWGAGTLLLAAAAIWLQPDWLYGWLKVIHIVALISWMVGLFYLPRLFVYHADCAPDSETARTLAVMEGRLLTVIMRPAMLVTWAAGLMLAWLGFGFAGGWLWAKIVLVVGLTGFHGYLARAAKRFASGEDAGTARQWRMRNEVPTILLILIVALVVLKPSL